MGTKKWTITADKLLSQDQVRDLLHFIAQERDLAIARGSPSQAIRDYYAVRTLLETGLRVAEFCALNLYDFHGQKITVRNGKGNKSRTILLTRTTSLIIKEWLTVREQLFGPSSHDKPMFVSRYNRRYSTRGIQKRIKILFRTLEFPESLSVHSLRHTYCSMLLASGKVSLATVRENLGHHSISVTNLYSHTIGNLDDVELYSNPSSENSENSEPQSALPTKKPNSFIKAFLRNTNLKAGDLK